MSKTNEAFVLLVLISLVFGLNAIWVTVTSALHGIPSAEGIVSSYRMVISVLVAYVVHRYLSLERIAYGLFLLACINSVVIAFQLLGAYHDRLHLPQWLHYGRLYGFENLELWRKGGILPSLQTSTLLAIYGIVYNAHNSRSLLAGIMLLFLVLSMVVGARTFLPVGLLAITYSLYRRPFITCGSLLVVAWNLAGIDSFQHFFYLRYGGLIDVFLKFDFAADYSAADTMLSYRPFSLSELLVGNGHARYSIMGGNDPFYTRWLFQSGLPSVILLLLGFTIIAVRCGRYTIIAYLLLILSLYHNIKGELFTSIGTFDLICISAFAFLRKKSVERKYMEVNQSAFVN